MAKNGPLKLENVLPFEAKWWVVKKQFLYTKKAKIVKKWVEPTLSGPWFLQ